MSLFKHTRYMISTWITCEKNSLNSVNEDYCYLYSLLHVVANKRCKSRIKKQEVKFSHSRREKQMKIKMKTKKCH